MATYYVKLGHSDANIRHGLPLTSCHVINVHVHVVLIVVVSVLNYLCNIIIAHPFFTRISNCHHTMAAKIIISFLTVNNLIFSGSPQLQGESISNCYFSAT